MIVAVQNRILSQLRAVTIINFSFCRNEFFPGLDRDYSILGLADSIKNLNNNGTFQYMLDAHSRRHWGGIFEAPTTYRLDTLNAFVRHYFSIYIKGLCVTVGQMQKAKLHMRTQPECSRLLYRLHEG